MKYFGHAINLKSSLRFLGKETCMKIREYYRDQMLITKPRGKEPIQSILVMQEKQQKQTYAEK